MDKAQAVQAYFSGFGWPAYDENAVPDDAQLPYITYEYTEANLGKPVILNPSLYDRSTSWKQISQKVAEIAADIGYGGKTLPFDGGVLYVTQGTPFAKRMSGDDDSIRRIIINIAAEYISAV